MELLGKERIAEADLVTAATDGHLSRRPSTVYLAFDGHRQIVARLRFKARHEPGNLVDRDVLHAITRMWLVVPDIKPPVIKDDLVEINKLITSLSVLRHLLDENE